MLLAPKLLPGQKKASWLGFGAEVSRGKVVVAKLSTLEAIGPEPREAYLYRDETDLAPPLIRIRLLGAPLEAEQNHADITFEVIG